MALLDVAERMVRSSIRNGAPAPGAAEWLRERERLCNPCPFDPKVKR
jgi:hypothetical protein